MRLFRSSPNSSALSDYWNALNRHSPADELAQLASRVEPTYLAAIHEVRDGYRPPLPDPVFADRLERILMNAAAHPGAEAIPLPRIPGRTRPGQSIKSPGRPAGNAWRPILGSGFGQALRIGLVILLIAVSAAGIWFAFGNSDDGSHVVVPAGTPEVEASPDISMYRGDAARTGVVYGPGPKGAPEELWTINLPTWFQWSPAVVEGVLYVEGGDAGLYAIDAFSGEPLWTFDTPSPVTSGPAVVDGVAYFGSDDGTFFAVDTTSQEELWTFPGIRQQSSAAVVDGIAYVVTPEGIFYGLDAQTGEEIWQAELGGDAAGAPAVADGLAYMGNGNRQFQAFDAKTGEQRWMFQGDGEGGYATPTIANGVAYITASGSDTNRFYVLNAASGDLLWEHSQAADHGLISATASVDRLYSISEDAVLHAFDASNGEPIWEFQLDGFVRTVPILSGSTLYVADNGGFIRAISAATGVEMWNYPIEGSVEYALTVAGAVIYTGTDLGNLYAITGSDSIVAPAADAGPGTAPAASPSPQADASEVEPGEINGSVVIDRVVTEGDGPLGTVSGLAQAPDGTLWMTDGANDRFVILGSEGTFIETWGVSGTGDGQFTFTRSNGDSLGSIAFAADGSFYVADTGNARVQHFDAERQFKQAWGGRGTDDGEFVSPDDIFVDSLGNVWVSDSLRDNLQKFDSEGNWLLTTAGTGAAEGQLDYQGYATLGPDDSIWVPDPKNNRIQQWASDGTFLQALDEREIPGQPVWIQSMTIDNAGNLVLADIDGSRLFITDQSGNTLGVWTLRDPAGAPIPNSGVLLVLDDGSYVIADFVNGTVYFFHLEPPLASPAAGSPVSELVAVAD